MSHPSVPDGSTPPGNEPVTQQLPVTGQPPAAVPGQPQPAQPQPGQPQSGQPYAPAAPGHPAPAPGGPQPGQFAAPPAPSAGPVSPAPPAAPYPGLTDPTVVAPTVNPGAPSQSPGEPGVPPGGQVSAPPVGGPVSAPPPGGPVSAPPVGGPVPAPPVSGPFAAPPFGGAVPGAPAPQSGVPFSTPPYGAPAAPGRPRSTLVLALVAVFLFLVAGAMTGLFIVKSSELSATKQRLTAQVANRDARLDASAKEIDGLRRDLEAANDRVKQIEQDLTGTRNDRDEQARQKQIIAKCLNLLGEALAADDRATFEKRAKAADAACKEADKYL